jgi:hypothetical protein
MRDFRKLRVDLTSASSARAMLTGVMTTWRLVVAAYTSLV